ncbi:hypothetical protein [Halomarina litorea]|uniref:hypothetical protein n=1 Tax=Halomarina litorea TaxID=2961595 RepID=UPI0020C3E9C9|nr:hypothetical protein [Halomarina sp. BCD28]
MRRRQVLALAAVGIGGCLSDSDPDGSGNGTTDEPTDAPTTTPSTDDTETATTTEKPDPPDLRAYPGDCPTYDATTVVCSDAAPDDVPLRMTPSASSAELPGDLSFTLSNDTDAEFQTNHYAARLHKRVDGEWFHVAPRAWPQPLTPISAGGSYTWTVEFAGGEGERPDAGETDRTVGGLGGGRYAFGNDGWFAGGSHESKTAAVAIFDLQGPPAELTTTDRLSKVSVEGGTVTGRWNVSHLEAGDRVATFTLERTDESAEGRLITEQVRQEGLHPRPLRDALALAVEHDAATVRLTGETGSSPPFGVGEPRVFEYEGSNYRISAEVTEGTPESG